MGSTFFIGLHPYIHVINRRGISLGYNENTVKCRTFIEA